MGPWDEDTQLARIASVNRILAKPNLSIWARKYWSDIRDRIAMDETRYNARVMGVYKDILKNETRDWL